MLDFSPNGYAVGILVLSSAYMLVHAAGETRKSVGFGGPLLSYISAVQLLWDPPGYLRRVWRSIPPGTHFVKVPGLTRWVVVGTRPEHYREIAGAPDRQVSLRMAVGEFLQARYTMFDDEIGDNIHAAPIREKLNKSLSDIVPEVYDEAKAVFQDEFPLAEEEWRPFVVLPTVIRLIARISNRVLVGLPLCRNLEYIDTCINYAVVVFVMSHVLSITPPFLRSFVNWAVSPVPSRVKKMTGFLQPLIDARRKGIDEEGDEYEPPTTLLSWLAEMAESNGKNDRDIVLRTMAVNFGSIHTTSLSLTHGLFSLLSQPQHLDTVLQEVEQCVQEEGWTRTAMDKMSFLDSFLKETQRFEVLGVLSGQRMVVVDCTLSGVFLPKGTMLGTNAIDSQFDQEVFGDNALEFDPYRFIKLEEKTGKRIQLPTSTLHTLTFGYGKHACPGRFFAAQEMKLLVAYFLIHYDLKLESSDGERPKNLWLNAFNMPNSKARVMMRKRKRKEAL